MGDLRIKNIKRKKKLNVVVNGKKMVAYKGETLLAALIASGYKTLKHSPVSHQPRGGFCGMGVCYECLVTINGIHNQRACMIEVEDKMEVELDG